MWSSRLYAMVLTVLKGGYNIIINVLYRVCVGNSFTVTPIQVTEFVFEPIIPTVIWTQEDKDCTLIRTKNCSYQRKILSSTKTPSLPSNSFPTNNNQVTIYIIIRRTFVVDYIFWVASMAIRLFDKKQPDTICLWLFFESSIWYYYAFTFSYLTRYRCKKWFQLFDPPKVLPYKINVFKRLIVIWDKKLYKITRVQSTKVYGLRNLSKFLTQRSQI